MLARVSSRFRVDEWLGSPVEPSVRESTWLTAPKIVFQALQKVVGDRSSKIMERTYAGSCTWLNGAYWMQELANRGSVVLIRNLAEGRTPVQTIESQVEPDFLFPLLRGRDVHAWRAKPSAMILVPHEQDDFGEPVSVAKLKGKYPRTFEYFHRFEQQLRSRSGYKQLHKKRSEFYVVGNVGNYSLAPYKVVFKDLTDVFQCAVVGPTAFGSLPARPVIPDHTLLFVSCDQEAEAFFISGLLNSIPVRTALYSASIGVQTQRYFPTDVSRVKLPVFEPQNALHSNIVKLSRATHAQEEGPSELDEPSKAELEIAEHAGKLWNFSKAELASTISYYRMIFTFRSKQSGTSDDDEGR